MDEIIAIFNCSPLMYLAKIGFLPLCEKLFTKCVTTPEVSRELLRKEHAPERPILEKAFKSWLAIEEPDEPKATSEFIQMGLHSGEVEVIALAQQIRSRALSHDKDNQKKHRSLVVIDDLDARDICNGLQIPVTGTIGILLLAARNHFITTFQCEKFIDILVDTTFYLTGRMVSAIRQELDLMKQ